MKITSFDQAKEARDRILSTQLIQTIKGLTIAGKGNYDNVLPVGRTVMPIDGHFIFEIVVDFDGGVKQTLETTEEVDLLLKPFES